MNFNGYHKLTSQKERQLFNLDKDTIAKILRFMPKIYTAGLIFEERLLWKKIN
jgi:hypothetical protein